LLKAQAEITEIFSQTSFDMDLLAVLFGDKVVEMRTIEPDRFALLVILGWSFHLHREP